MKKSKTTRRLGKELDKYERKLVRIGKKFDNANIDSADLVLMDQQAFQTMCLNVLIDLTYEVDRLRIKVRKLERKQ